MKARIKAAPVKVPAPKESKVYDSASGTSSLKVTPPRDPAMSQATATEKVYSNGKVSFTREQLLRSLDLPPDTIDFRMEPFLQELAEELGRPRRKPAPAPVRCPQRSGNRHHSCNYNSTIRVPTMAGSGTTGRIMARRPVTPTGWRLTPRGADGSLQIPGPSAGQMIPAVPGSGEAARDSAEFCTHLREPGPCNSNAPTLKDGKRPASARYCEIGSLGL